jgi:hypothetical protein
MPNAMGLRLVRPTLMDLAYLAVHMRGDEIEQYLALTGADTYDADTAARGFAAIPGVSFALVAPDDLPVCAGGFEQVRPGVWQTWMVGTDDGWARYWRGMTKHTRRVMDALLAADGNRRIQTNALATRRAAHEWYRRGLGMQDEGVWRSFGVHGEDVMCFARVRED